MYTTYYVFNQTNNHNSLTFSCTLCLASGFTAYSYPSRAHLATSQHREDQRVTDGNMQVVVLSPEGGATTHMREVWNSDIYKKRTVLLAIDEPDKNWIW